MTGLPPAPHELIRATDAATADWFWRVFTASPVSLQLFAPDGRCVAANAAWERLWEAPAGAIVGHNVLEDRVLVSAGAREEIRKAFHGTPVTLPPTFYDPATIERKGRARHVVLHLTPLPGPDPAYVLMGIEDVTELVKARRRADVQFALTEVLARAPSTNEAIRELLEALGTSFDVEFTALWMVGTDETAINCNAVWTPRTTTDAFREFEKCTSESRFRRGEGLPGTVWESGQAVWIADVLDRANFPRLPWARKAGIQGGIAFPVTVGGTVIAVVEMYSVRPMAADAEVAKLAETAGRQIGQYLQRRRLEDELLESQAANRAVAETSLDAIVSMDVDGRVIDFNPAAEKMFGYSRDAVVGRQMAELIIPPQYRAAHRAGLARHKATGESRILNMRLELSAQRADGTEFPVELTITRMHRRYAPIFTGFIRDLTERRRHEQEREMLLARERIARDAAEAANRLKDEFIATASHELRTPINAIRGWLRMLGTGAVPPERVAETIAKIDRNAEVQARLVDDLLDVSTLVTGRMRFTVDELDVREVIQNACESLKPAAESKNLTMDIRAATGVVIRGDAIRLQQVFWNLLSNAVKFTPPGGTVTVRVDEEPGEVRVVVSDTGRGIEPELLPAVFEKFRQGSSSAGGLGLGLAIVKHIIEAHGGTVHASNRADRPGAEFIVSLPRA